MRSLLTCGVFSILSNISSSTLHSLENFWNVLPTYWYTCCTNSFEASRGSYSDDDAEWPLNGDNRRPGQRESLNVCSSLTIDLAWYKHRVNSIKARSVMGIDGVESGSNRCAERLLAWSLLIGPMYSIFEAGGFGVEEEEGEVVSWARELSGVGRPALLISWNIQVSRGKQSEQKRSCLGRMENISIQKARFSYCFLPKSHQSTWSLTEGERKKLMSMIGRIVKEKN